MAPEHSLEVPEGLGSAPEVSGMSQNGPDMSPKVLEASRRSWKVPEGYGQYHPLPCAPGLGGQATYAALAGQEGGGAPRRGNPPPSGITNSCFGRFPVGRCGKLWKAWETKLDSQNSISCAPGPLGTYIRWGKGGEKIQVSGAPWLSLVASCSTIRPRFRALI